MITVNHKDITKKNPLPKGVGCKDTVNVVYRNGELDEGYAHQFRYDDTGSSEDIMTYKVIHSHGDNL